MYMPELGTTLLRNKFSRSQAAVGFFLFLFVVSAAGQTAPQSAPAGSATPSTQPAPPTSGATQNQAPAPQTNSAQPAGTQGASGAQGATQNQAPAGQNNPAPPPAAQGPAQAPEATDNGVFVFRAVAQEVTLHATVVDEHNHLVTNLTKPDFMVFENDKPQQIHSFRQEDFPVAMGIVIDNSGSMREKREQVNKAAINLVKASNPEDQVFVVNFNDEYYLDQDFTGDIKKLQSALEHVESRGGTALYDAVVASADYLVKSPLQRKVLFVVTDGEDDASQETLDQAVHHLQQENGPTVYAIGLLGEEKTRRAKRALESIADRTGGIAFFPPTLNEVDEISRSIAHDIRNQYTITYQPTTPKSVGGFRRIHVDAHAKPYKKLTVRTRSGYYPGQEQGGAGGGE